MKHTSLTLFIAAAFSLPSVASASTIAIDSTTNLTASAGSNYANGVGHVFSVNSSALLPGQSLVVTQLGTDGYFGGSSTPAGITLKLWDASNPTTAVATVSFSGAESFTVVDYAHGSYDGRRYMADITPITLDPSKTYIITAYGYHGSGATEASYINGAPGQTTASEITFLGERYSPTAGAMPTVADGSAYKYGGPTFAFDVVPEPTTPFLLAFGSIGLLRRRRG